jgi:hypothetical protein
LLKPDWRSHEGEAVERLEATRDHLVAQTPAAPSSRAELDEDAWMLRPPEREVAVEAFTIRARACHVDCDDADDRAITRDEVATGGDARSGR